MLLRVKYLFRLLHYRVVNHDYALSLHDSMFIPALERLATEDQKAKWLTLARQYKIIGTYAQTELGHGILHLNY